MTRTVIPLDTATLQFCAALARTTAEAMFSLPNGRAHHKVAGGALIGLAEEIEGVAKGALPVGGA